MNEVAYNPAGGVKEKVAYANLLSFAVKADTEKLAGLTGGVFTLNLSDRNGRNLSDIAGLGTLQQVQEIFGRARERISEIIDNMQSELQEDRYISRSVATPLKLFGLLLYDYDIWLFSNYTPISMRCIQLTCAPVK